LVERARYHRIEKIGLGAIVAKEQRFGDVGYPRHLPRGRAMIGSLGKELATSLANVIDDVPRWAAHSALR
jgi:hypothetical protein